MQVPLNAWPVGVAVSTTDSDSVDGGSIPSQASFARNRVEQPAGSTQVFLLFMLHCEDSTGHRLLGQASTLIGGLSAELLSLNFDLSNLDRNSRAGLLRFVVVCKNEFLLRQGNDVIREFRQQDCSLAVLYCAHCHG